MNNDQFNSDYATSVPIGSTVTTTGYVAPAHPAPCPTCGHCPTCGRGGHYAHPYVPYWGIPQFPSVWSLATPDINYTVASTADKARDLAEEVKESIANDWLRYPR